MGRGGHRPGDFRTWDRGLRDPDQGSDASTESGSPRGEGRAGGWVGLRPLSQRPLLPLQPRHHLPVTVMDSRGK